MLLATGIMFHRIMSYGRSAVWSAMFRSYLLVFLVTVAFIHCYRNERALFQTVFVLMVLVAGYRTARLVREVIEDPNMKKRLQRLSRSGTGKSSMEGKLELIFWGRRCAC